MTTLTVGQEDYGTDTSSLTVTSRYIDHEDYDTDTSSLTAKITSRYIDHWRVKVLYFKSYRENYFKVHRLEGL